MNKTELIAAAAKECGLTQTDIFKALGGILTTIEKAVAAGDKVQLIGFGTFEPRFRAGRSVRNPQTGESAFVPDKKTPAFKAGKAFKDLLNKPKKVTKAAVKKATKPKRK